MLRLPEPKPSLGINISPGGTQTMNFFKLRCPSCGETRARHRIPPSRYSPVAPMVVGGILMALVFEVSRKPQFRREKCGVPFGAHTLTSRLFQILWVWFVISLAVGRIWVFLATVM